jgi:hypothetical protein
MYKPKEMIYMETVIKYGKKVHIIDIHIEWNVDKKKRHEDLGNYY